jgi:hypothetical protein
MAIADKDEIMFWRGHRDDGSLIQTVRLFRDRAVPFFGAFAVFGANEPELLRILEAQEILVTSDADLLKQLNRVNELMAPELEKVEPAELREQLRKESHYTQEDVEALRSQARQQLARALGKDFPDA